jgi:hypothetical protein
LETKSVFSGDKDSGCSAMSSLHSLIKLVAFSYGGSAMAYLDYGQASYGCSAMAYLECPIKPAVFSGDMECIDSSLSTAELVFKALMTQHTTNRIIPTAIRTRITTIAIP